MCASVCAQTKLAPEIHHFISINGDLGYSALLHTIENHPASNGLDAHIGLAHRYYYNHFSMTVGAEVAYQFNTNRINDMDFPITMRDTEGDIFQMHVQVYNSHDRTHMINLNFPVLFGGEWSRFYFLVGPKVAINLYGSAYSEAEYTTTGEYERYYADFSNMENHQFVSHNTMESGVLDMKWNANLLAHVEVGARVDNFYKYRTFRLNPDLVRMYLSAYMDFGVLNLLPAQQHKAIFDYRDTEDKGLQFYIQPLMLSNLANDAVVRNLNVGIKYTIAFEIPQKGKSHVYDYDKDERDYIKRGANQSIQQ